LSVKSIEAHQEAATNASDQYEHHAIAQIYFRSSHSHCASRTPRGFRFAAFAAASPALRVAAAQSGRAKRWLKAGTRPSEGQEGASGGHRQIVTAARVSGAFRAQPVELDRIHLSMKSIEVSLSLSLSLSLPRSSLPPTTEERGDVTALNK